MLVALLKGGWVSGSHINIHSVNIAIAIGSSASKGPNFRAVKTAASLFIASFIALNVKVGQSGVDVDPSSYPTKLPLGINVERL